MAMKLMILSVVLHNRQKKKGMKFLWLHLIRISGSWLPKTLRFINQVIDILGLMGDASDNIPGIAGVGEKTAAKLLAQYGSVENVLEDAENIKGALGEKIRAGKEMAILSKKLATIITDVPRQFHEEDFRVKAYNTQVLKDLFAEFEFKTLGKRILGDEYNVFVVEKQVIQTDLFGNAMEVPIH